MSSGQLFCVEVELGLCSKPPEWSYPADSCLPSVVGVVLGLVMPRGELWLRPDPSRASHSLPPTINTTHASSIAKAWVRLWL